MAATTRAALGFRAHTGWAAMVAIAGPPAAPEVLLRRKLDLVEGGDVLAAQAYHAAAELALPAAERLVRRATEDARRRAGAAVREIVADLRKRGNDVVASGIVVGSGRLPESLEAILRSHPLVHTAEGELYRRVLAEASEALGVPVTGVPSRDLQSLACETLGLRPDALRARLIEAGRRAGKPWTQDQKESMLVAWLALAGGARRRGRRSRSKIGT